MELRENLIHNKIQLFLPEINDFVFLDKELTKESFNTFVSTCPLNIEDFS